MRILLVSPGVPDRFHRIRLTHIIDSLLPDHTIKAVFLNTKKKSRQSFRSGFKASIIDKSTLSSLFDCLTRIHLAQPFEVSYCASSKMRSLVKNYAKDSDVVLVKRLRAIQYLPENLKKPVIIDSTDAMSLYYGVSKKCVAFWKKPLYYHEWFKYRRYERATAKKFKNWVVSSEVDAKYLKKIFPKDTNIWAIPNVVDTNYYKFSKEPEKNTILFSGLMDKEVNQSAIYFFIEKILPLIEKKLTGVKLNIVGPNPPLKLLRVESKNISVRGEVKDIRKWIEKSSVIVVPILLGTGTRNKILQAWSHRRPVVSTSVGAQGLNYKNNKNIFIADRPYEFASRVIELLTNQQLANRIAKAGRELVEKECGLSTMRANYNTLFEHASNQFSSSKKAKSETGTLLD